MLNAMEEQKIREAALLSLREESIIDLVTGLRKAISDCNQKSLQLDTSDYFEWSRQCINNQSKYLGRIEGLIQIFEIEYKSRGGKL